MSHEEALVRIAELERQRTELEIYRADAREQLRQMPFEPLTEEEIRQMEEGPYGQPISEILAELEREVAGHRRGVA